MKKISLITTFFITSFIASIINAEKEKDVMQKVKNAFKVDIQQRDLTQIAKFGEGIIKNNPENIYNITNAEAYFDSWKDGLNSFKRFIKDQLGFNILENQEKTSIESYMAELNSLQYEFIKNIDKLYKIYRIPTKYQSYIESGKEIKTFVLNQSDIGEFIQQYNVSIQSLTKKIDDLSQKLKNDLKNKKSKIFNKLDAIKNLLNLYEKFLEKIKTDFGKIIPNYSKHDLKKQIDANIGWALLIPNLSKNINIIKERFYAISNVLVNIHHFVIKSGTKDLLPIFSLKKEGMTKGTIEYFIYEVKDAILNFEKGLKEINYPNGKTYYKLWVDIKNFSRPSYISKVTGKTIKSKMENDVDNFIEKINTIKTYRPATWDAKEVLLYLVNKYKEVQQKIFKDWSKFFKYFDETKLKLEKERHDIDAIKTEINYPI